MRLPDGSAVQSSDYKPLETIVSKAVKERQKFERLVMTKDELLEMFKYNKYKQHIIKDKIPDGTSTTVYRNGPLIDLCRGPHVPDTSRIETFQIMKNSASYFLGDAANDSLQRIYGISFPDKKQMAAHLKFLEEAAKRDHRLIGKNQELFYFEDVSPGSAMWLRECSIPCCPACYRKT
jgi:threonyl-tRNA synthetase